MERPIDSKFDILAFMLILNVTSKKCLYRSSESSTSYISHIEILGTWNVRFTNIILKFVC